MLLAAVVALAGCQREAISPDEHAARTAVARYNEALVLAFRSGRTDPLRELAAPDEVERIGGTLRALAADGRVMVARQLASTVVSTTVSPRPDGVTLVETVESWSYEHRALADRDTPATEKRARYRLVYELIRRDGRFVVHRLVEHELPPGEAP